MYTGNNDGDADDEDHDDDGIMDMVTMIRILIPINNIYDTNGNGHDTNHKNGNGHVHTDQWLVGNE